MTQLSGKIFVSKMYVSFVKGKTECILGSFDSIGEQRLVYNVCKNSSHCCDVSWKGMFQFKYFGSFLRKLNYIE